MIEFAEGPARGMGCGPIGVCARGRRLLTSALLLVVGLISIHGAPVTFEFQVRDAGSAQPLAREIFADVALPSGVMLRHPAFFLAEDRWCVRARADQAGSYRVTRVIEHVGAEERTISVSFKDGDTHRVRRAKPVPSITRDADDPTRLAFTTGPAYTPIGANLAWTAGERVTWHLRALRDFESEGLNWTRLWMCHWGAMNLDWLPPDMGPSPAPGGLDTRIAENWDRVLAAAEEHGVYAQIVLQHHGQYTTGANSNWAENPWNAANPGGFLASPGEFFTSPRAIALTEQKYRYIVARWACSPAILAWELFNEVHWTNAYQDDEPAVAAWHARMAGFLRAIDPYHHLITTSVDDSRSPIYAAMDYYQPHLYAVNMLTAARSYGIPFQEFDRPVFFGEIGDDKMPVSDAEKAAGSQLVPQVWASLMGPGPNPGQSWLGEEFLRTHRLGELGAVARFLRETGIAGRPALIPFSPAATATDTIPLSVTPGYDWSRNRATRAALPTDGSDSLEQNEIPGILVGSPASIAEGYASELTLQMQFPAATQGRLEIAEAGVRGAAVSVFVDDQEVASHVWPRLPGAPALGPQPANAPKRPAALVFPISSGDHAVTVRNTGRMDWLRVGRVEFDLPTPILAAAGKRNESFVALWVWNKAGVHAVAPSAPASATFLLEDLPAGTWQVTWWDAEKGKPGKPARLHHDGGTLRLPTPPIARHAAVVLDRVAAGR